MLNPLGCKRLLFVLCLNHPWYIHEDWIYIDRPGKLCLHRVCRFLDRPLLEDIRKHLVRPGGLVVWSTFLQVKCTPCFISRLYALLHVVGTRLASFHRYILCLMLLVLPLVRISSVNRLCGVLYRNNKHRPMSKAQNWHSLERERTRFGQYHT